MMEKLNSKSPSITKNFIGIESTMAEFIPSYFGFENNVRMIGIAGMGGLGKTTIARVVYDEFRNCFEGSSFIANVTEDSRKHGFPKLQQQLLADILEDKNICISNVYDGVDTIKKMLCCKKVLLVLDDVCSLDQLEKLAGEDDWFGLGSRIIITSRDSQLLTAYGVHKIYRPKELNNDDALKLFCLKAFKNEQPKKGYMQLSQEVVKYARGLPLALITLGSFFNRRTIVEWQTALHGLKKICQGHTYDIFKMIYDGLEEMWKEIFLDIACFFRGWKKNQVIQILENCGFNARIGISVLVKKSLLTVDDNGYLGMHDNLAEIGREIIRSESDGKLGKQSRLLLIGELLHVLDNDMATEAIQARVTYCIETCFNFEELPEVLSKIMRSDNLKFINLSYSRNLIRTPDFSGVPMLEEIDLFGCLSLVKIHPSIGQLSRLRYLNLSVCTSLTDLPSMSTEMQSLAVLCLGGCSKLNSFPKFTGIMKSLSELYLNSTAIKKVAPSSIDCLPALTLLDLSSCTNLECLPSNMDNLRSLQKLTLSGCSKLKSLPRLPSTVRFIDAIFCDSLKWTPTRIKLSSWSQPLSQWCSFDEIGSRLEFTILFHFLQEQELLCHKTVYKIPSSLTHHQSEGNSIIIDLPSNWYNSKWIGFALWVSISNIRRREYCSRARVIVLGDMPLNCCASELFSICIHWEVRICLLYLSRDEWFAAVGNGEYSQIKVIFENYKRTIDVRECGVSMIYEQDVDEFNQTNAQCLIESFGEEVSIFKLTVGDDDDVNTVGDDDVVYTVGDDDDDDDVNTVGDDGVVYTVGDDEDDDDDDDDEDNYYDAYTVSDDND